MLFQVIQQKSSETKTEVERYSTVQRRITDSTCPKCNGAMENGFIVDKGHSGNYISTWVQGTPKRRFRQRKHRTGLSGCDHALQSLRISRVIRKVGAVLGIAQIEITNGVIVEYIG